MTADPNTLARVNAYDPFLRTVEAGTVPREVTEANRALDEYLDGAPLDIHTLARVVAAGARALARADADATVLALKDTRDMLAQERDALRTEMAAAKTALTTDVQEHISAAHAHNQNLMGTWNAEVRKATAALPESTRESVQTMLTDLLRNFGSAVVANASAAFDPQVETSPLSRVVSAINASVAQHTRAVDARIGDLETKIAVDAARNDAREQSSLKGTDFESVLEELIGDYAAGAGIRATSTGTATGKLRGSKKGDFLLSENDGSPLVVVEAKNKAGGNTIPAIHAYLDEAEPNRGVTTSVWVVKGREQHKGVPLTMLTPSRWVVALEDDTPGLLNAVLAVAVATARRDRVAGDDSTQDVSAAQAHLKEAQEAVDDLASIEKSAASIITTATSITKRSDALRTRLVKSLTAAAEALDGSACTPSLSVVRT